MLKLAGILLALMILFGILGFVVNVAGAITKAVKSVDHAAEVTIDLARHLVTVKATAVDAQHIRDAIAGAGYTPEQVMSAAAATAGAGSTRTCCGSCH